MGGFQGPGGGAVSPEDLRAAADRLGCSEAMIRAVSKVESRPVGAFLAPGVPACLFERHLFHRFTDGRFDAQAPLLSNPVPSYRDHSYGHYSDQPARVAAAALLDREAALRATSWGLYQILGDNYAECGFADVESFVSAMTTDVAAHLSAFVAFNLHDPEKVAALRAKDCYLYARLYNGPGNVEQYGADLTAALAVAEAET